MDFGFWLGCALQLTADGELVVTHEADVSKTTSGTGQVHSRYRADIELL